MPSESHSWTRLDGMRQQVHDTGIESAGVAVVQPSVGDMSQQQLLIQSGQEEVIWLPPSGVVWLQTAELGAGDCPGNQATYVNSDGMAWLQPDTVTWEKGQALDSLQDLSLLGDVGEEHEDEEDSENADLSSAAVKGTRRKRRHRAGRRRQRAAARRAERRQWCPPTLALVGPAGRHLRAPAGAPAEIEQGQDDLAVSCLQQLESGSEREQRAAIAALHGMVLALSFQQQGCRVVQLAFEIASRSDIEAMAAELHGHIRDAVTSPHANFVVQKAVEVLPSAKTSFVPEELLGVAVLTASHRYGCRIICRIVEHPGSDHSHALIAELLEQAEELCGSVYGRHVINAIMEHGQGQHRKRIVTALHSLGVLGAAKNRHASYVLEAALAFADKEDQEALMAELLSDPETIPMLVESQCGCHIVKALIRSHGKYSQTVLAYLGSVTERLKVTKIGRLLLEELKLWL